MKFVTFWAWSLCHNTVQKSCRSLFTFRCWWCPLFLWHSKISTLSSAYFCLVMGVPMHVLIHNQMIALWLWLFLYVSSYISNYIIFSFSAFNSFQVNYYILYYKMHKIYVLLYKISLLFKCYFWIFFYVPLVSVFVFVEVVQNQ